MPDKFWNLLHYTGCLAMSLCICKKLHINLLLPFFPTISNSSTSNSFFTVSAFSLLNEQELILVEWNCCIVPTCTPQQILLPMQTFCCSCLNRSFQRYLLVSGSFCWYRRQVPYKLREHLLVQMDSGLHSHP